MEAAGYQVIIIIDTANARVRVEAWDDRIPVALCGCRNRDS